MTEQAVARRALTPLATDLDAVDWSASTDTPLAPLRRVRPVPRRSRAVEMLSLLHAADGSSVAALVDLLVLCAVVFALPVVPLWFRIAMPFAVVGAGYVGQVYAARDSVQTRGVLWYPGLVVGPIAVVSTVPVALRVVGVTSAVTAATAAFGALVGLRCLTWLLLVVARRRGRGLRNTLVIGDATAAATVWRRLVEFPEAGLLPIQLLTFDAARDEQVLQRAVDHWNIEHIVLAGPEQQDAAVIAELPRQADRAPYFSVVPAVTGLFLDPRSVTEVGGVPLIPLGRLTQLRHRFPGKRAFDVVSSALLLVALTPLLALIALAIKLDDGGPVLFRQTRVGRHTQVFGFWKFRTMVVGADQMLDELMGDNFADGLLYKFRSDPRVTRVGAFLRRTSLDELPQLWNVLRGQMSMVGPRPLAVEPHAFSPGDTDRHSVLPGITGYWQLSGGPELSYEEMIRLDLAYIRNWSLWLDLRLVLRTVPALLHRHGAV